MLLFPNFHAIAGFALIPQPVKCGNDIGALPVIFCLAISKLRSLLHRYYPVGTIQVDRIAISEPIYYVA